jgi:hypothetical protein
MLHYFLFYSNHVYKDIIWPHLYTDKKPGSEREKGGGEHNNARKEGGRVSVERERERER